MPSKSKRMSQLVLCWLVTAALTACATAPTPSPSTMEQLQTNSVLSKSALSNLPATSNVPVEPEKTSPPSPPTAQQPSYNPSDPNIPSDIGCKPKLTLEPIKAVALVKKTEPDLPSVQGPLAPQLDAHGALTFDKMGALALVRIPYVAHDTINGIVTGPVQTMSLDDYNKIVAGHTTLRPVVGPIGALQVDPYRGSLVLQPTLVAVIPFYLSNPTAKPPPTLLNPAPVKPPPDSPAPPTVIGMTVLDANGRPLSMRAFVSAMSDHYCYALSPWTRLILENAGFSANDTYSNQAGYTNATTANIKTTIANTYQVGVGYSNKPILKQLRALIDPADGREAASKQGTFIEDFVFNAVTVNAYVSYGRALQIQNGVHVNAYNTKPYYGVSATYALDLERMWIYATKDGARPADQGYYYQPAPAARPFFVDPGQPRGLRFPSDDGDTE